MGDGSLGRAVFQGSPEGVFRGSCRARRRPPSCTPILRASSSRSSCSPIVERVDIWTHTKDASSGAREKGLGSRLRDSLPSLNQRERLCIPHTEPSFSSFCSGFLLAGFALCLLRVQVPFFPSPRAGISRLTRIEPGFLENTKLHEPPCLYATRSDFCSRRFLDRT